MQEYQQLFLEKFSNKIEERFKHFCEREKLVADIKNLLRYLIDEKLLNKKNIRKFLILEEFKELHSNDNLRKTQAIKLLAKKFNISDRTIWSMLNRKDQNS